MAVWNSVMSSVVAEENRFDGEYYSPFYLQMDTTLSSIANVDVLGRLAFSIRKGIFDISPNRYRNKGIPLVRTLQIKSPLLSKEGLVYIDTEDHERNFRKTGLVSGDIVFTKIGAGIGDVAVLPLDFDRYNFSQNVAGVSINREKINGFYLLAYLATKWGRNQLLRFMMPSGQGKLELRDIKKIKIVRLGYDEVSIAGLIVDAENSARESQEKYLQAQQLLEVELGLDKLTFQKRAGYVVRYSDVEISLRSDAQHYQPRFKQLIDHISGFSSARVRDIRSLNRRGLQPIYVQNGQFNVVNSQHLGPQHINYEGLERTSTKAFTAALEAHIQQDDLLIYTTGAHIGRTNVYLHDTPAMASNHVNIVRLQPGIDAAYMALVFQSIVGRFQTQKHARGSAQAELYPSDIDRFVVPLLDPDTQKAIGDLVRESLVKQQESRRLLEQAKARVEQLIEQAARP